MTTVEWEEGPCAFGCAANSTLLFKARDRLGVTQDVFSIVQCDGCGLIRTSPRPTKEAIGLFYPSGYGPHQADAGQLFSADTMPAPLRRPAEFLAARATGLVLPADLKPGSALEIACGAGAALDRLTAQGWRACGIEISEAAAARARARGHKVSVGDIEQMAAPDGVPFDLLIAMHIVEHLHDPVATMRKLAGWVKPGGAVLILAPDTGALGWRFHSDRWQPIEAPRHLFHFSRQTLARLLEVTGWRPEYFTTQSIANSALQSAMYWAEDTGRSSLACWFRDVADNRRLRQGRRALGLVLGLLGQSGVQICIARRV